MKYDPAIHDAPTQPLPPKGPKAGRDGQAQARDVVVVDHDPEVQTRVARTLTERGARVVATSSPDAALTLMSQWHDAAGPGGLVLVSEALPGQSGLELARKIREDHPTAQVVLMAANESAELRASAMIVGALGLLVKPFNLQALFDLLDLSALSPAE